MSPSTGAAYNLQHKEEYLLKIKITGPERIPTVTPGKIYDAKAGAPNDAGEQVYFIHHAGEWLAIRASECEIVHEVAK